MSNRISPSIHASTSKVGQIKVGNNGKNWIVLEKNKIKKWYLLGEYKKYKTLVYYDTISYIIVIGEKNIYIFYYNYTDSKKKNNLCYYPFNITNYINYFIGKNTQKYSFSNKEIYKKLYTGSSILIQYKKNKYIFINWEIFSFSTNEPIIEFHSLLGKDNRFYPFALTENYVYLIKENVYLHRNFDDKNPLDIYYDNKKLGKKFPIISIEI
jgi:hypothetical protein